MCRWYSIHFSYGSAHNRCVRESMYYQIRFDSKGERVIHMYCEKLTNKINSVWAKSVRERMLHQRKRAAKSNLFEDCSKRVNISRCFHYKTKPAKAFEREKNPEKCAISWFVIFIFSCLMFWLFWICQTKLAVEHTERELVTCFLDSGIFLSCSSY